MNCMESILFNLTVLLRNCKRLDPFSKDIKIAPFGELADVLRQFWVWQPGPRGQGGEEGCLLNLPHPQSPIPPPHPNPQPSISWKGLLAPLSKVRIHVLGLRAMGRAYNLALSSHHVRFQDSLNDVGASFTFCHSRILELKK